MTDEQYLRSMDTRLSRVETTSIDLVKEVSGATEKLENVSDKLDSLDNKVDSLINKGNQSVMSRADWMKIISVIIAAVLASVGIDIGVSQ